MAKAPKKKASKKASPAKKTAPSTAANVTRVRATDAKPTTKKQKSTPVAEVKATATAKMEVAPAKKRRKVSPKVVLKPVKATGSYFKGAWVELKQVRWPTRGATWSMTGAVLLYSAFFVVIVLLLDAGFKYIFELILGK